MAAFTLTPDSASAGIFKKKSKKAEEPQKESKYDKLFKDKCHSKAEGPMTLHIADSKIYLELPLAMLGRPFLMGSTIDKISDAQEASVGMNIAAPIRIYFQQRDSIIEMSRVSTPIVTRDTINIREALNKSNISPIMKRFDIKAYGADSLSVLLDISSFILDDDPLNNPIDPKGFNNMDGWVKRTTSFKSARSFAHSVSANEQSASITSCISFDKDMSIFGIFDLCEDLPLSAYITKSFLLLPEHNNYTPRKTDKRIGVLTTDVKNFDAAAQKSEKLTYAARWNVSEKSPIVFYVDNLFPSLWRESIDHCAQEWNRAFAQIGIDKAIEIREFDPASEAINISNSYIHYVLTPNSTIRDNVWVDPATGEIIKANIYIPHNMPQSIQRDMFLQTASFNPEARHINLSDKEIASAMNTMLLRSMGHALGLTDNMAGSTSYPIDSLRSKSFTEKYGLSSSVMDQLPFNYLLREQDFNRGAALSQQCIGSYDFQAIAWLYGQDKPLPSTLYSRPQSKKAYYDPRGMALDLGNNAIESARHAFQNLRTVIINADKWLEVEDYDYTYRETIYNHIINQTNEYVKQVFQQVGGIYVNTPYRGATSYQSVSKELQRESLKMIMEEIDAMSWIDDPALLHSSGAVVSAATYSQMFFSNFIFTQLNAMTLAESKSSDPYTQEQALSDVMEFILRETKAGREPSSIKLHQLRLLTDRLIMESNVESRKANYEGNSQISFDIKPDNSAMWYGKLLDIKQVYQYAIYTAPTETLRDEYKYQLYNIEKALKAK